MKMDNDNDGSEPKDHSGIVLHIRTVHMLLIIVSIVVFTFSIKEGKSETQLLKREFDQLAKYIPQVNDRIGKAKSNYSSSFKYKAKKLPDFCELAKTAGGTYSPNILIKKLFDKKKQYLFSLNTQISGKATNFNLALNYERKFEAKNTYCASERSKLYCGASNSVSNLMECWNSLDAKSVLFDFKKLDTDNAIIIPYTQYIIRNKIDLTAKSIVAKNVKMVEKIVDSEKIDISKRDSSGMPIAIINSVVYHNRGLKVVRIDKKSTSGLLQVGGSPLEMAVEIFVWNKLYQKAEHANYVILIPFKTEKTMISRKKEIMRVLDIDPKIIPAASFKQSFPTVTKFMSGRGDSTKLTDLYKMVNQEVEQYSESQKLNVMGLKLDSGNVIKFGAIILISIMVYYWLLLRVLVYKLMSNNKAFEIPWIGIFPDTLSFILTVLSTIFIPCVVSVIQLFRTFDVMTLQGQIISYGSISVLALVSLALIINTLQLNRAARRFSIS